MKNYFKQLKEKEENESFGNSQDDDDDEMISFDSEGEDLSDLDDEDSQIKQRDSESDKRKSKKSSNDISKDLISYASDDGNTDDEEKIEYYNEYVMKPVPTCMGYINYIIYFPVNLVLVIIFKDFHIVET